MNPAQQFAYEWAKSQSYPSIAAKHAKTLAEVIDEIEADMHRLHLCEVCKHNLDTPDCTCECETCGLPRKCWECTDGSAFEWKWSFVRRRIITNE